MLFNSEILSLWLIHCHFSSENDGKNRKRNSAHLVLGNHIDEQAIRHRDLAPK